MFKSWPAFAKVEQVELVDETPDRASQLENQQS